MAFIFVCEKGLGPFNSIILKFNSTEVCPIYIYPTTIFCKDLV